MKPNLLSRLVVSVAVITVACGSAELPAGPVAARSAAATRPPSLTVEDVYRRVQQAISRPGLLYQATIRETYQQAGTRTTATITQWVDARRNVAREEVQFVPPGVPAGAHPLMQTMLLTHEGRYLRRPDGEVIWTSPGATTCPGATRAASVVLGSDGVFRCPDPVQHVTAAVQRGQYVGHPTIVLVSTLLQSGTFTATQRLHLDAGTFLPIALDAVVDSASGQMLRQRGVFTHRFIAAHAVPANYFDPAAIGYVQPENQLNHVPRGFTVYWLGTHVAGVRGLPPLLLTKVDPGGTAGGGYLFILTYSRTDDRFGAGGVTLQEWPLARWEHLPPITKGPYGPCWAHRDITTPRGRARIFLGFENAPPPGSKSCPAPPYNRFTARVYLGQTMVLVDAPEAVAGSLRITNPYNTRKGIEMVVRALQPRVPTHVATGSNK